MPPVQLGKLPIYSGAWDCAVKTIQREGFFGLYKGKNLMFIFHIIKVENLIN